MPNVYTADNGMRLGPSSTAGQVELLYGFTYTSESGRPEGAGSDTVTATFAPGSNQATVRTAIRSALVTWATARGDVIVRHILADLTIVVP
jgi:hypothetical protein